MWKALFVEKDDIVQLRIRINTQIGDRERLLTHKEQSCE